MRSITVRETGGTLGAGPRCTAGTSSDSLRERLTPVVEHAIAVAREQAAQAALAAGQAKEWAAPRVSAAVERGLLAAGPTVEAAAERMAPAVDAARDRIVEDLLPRLVEAVQAATTAGHLAGAAAMETVSHQVEEAARAIADATPTARARRRSRRTRLLWFGAGATAVAAAVAAALLARGRDREPTWELAPTEVTSATPTSAAPSEPSAEVRSDTTSPGIPAVKDAPASVTPLVPTEEPSPLEEPLAGGGITEAEAGVVPPGEPTNGPTA